MKVIDKVSSTTAEWAADEFINYFGHFTSIEDYLRFVKKEVISQTSSLFPLHDEFFNEDIHPEDMEFDIRFVGDKELDTYRDASNQGHGWFSNLETTLRNELKIPSLKVRMNRQIGWFIEVTSTHQDKVPAEWTRKQQMTNGNRYVTDDLREQDDLLLTAESKSKTIEYRLFCSLRDLVRKHANQLA